jgi:hypothetical protein
MGSDLYMEERSFRPRPAKARWLDEETLLIETDIFYHGYQEYYRGPVTDSNRVLLEKVVKIPPKPEPKKPETLWKVFHCAPDYTAHPEQPVAVFEDQHEAVSFAKKKGGYGYGKDWFVERIDFYRKDA